LWTRGCLLPAHLRHSDTRGQMAQAAPKPDLCSARGPRSIVSFHLRRMAKGVSTGVWLGEQRNPKL